MDATAPSDSPAANAAVLALLLAAGTLGLSALGGYLRAVWAMERCVLHVYVRASDSQRHNRSYALSVACGLTIHIYDDTGSSLPWPPPVMPNCRTSAGSTLKKERRRRRKGRLAVRSSRGMG